VSPAAHGESRRRSLLSCALEGSFAGGHLVKHYAKREDVSAWVEFLSFHLFGRHVSHSADGGAVGGEVPDFLGEVVGAAAGSRRTGFGNTKIQNFRVLALGNEDVAGFDVAVNDLCGVRGIERIGDLDAERYHRFNGKRTPGDAHFQLEPFQQFPHDEGSAVLLPDVVDRTDVGMVQRRGKLRLPAKTREARSSSASAGGRNFSATKRWRRVSSAR